MRKMPAPRKPKEEMPAYVRERVERLRYPEGADRWDAAEELGSYGHRSAVPYLIITLRRDKQPGVRSRAADALGKIRDERAAPPLIKALHDPDLKVRRTAANALGWIKHKRAVPHLLKLLQDPDADLRKEAVAALGKIGDESTAPQLLKALDDSDWPVKAKAAEALGQIKHQRAVSRLLDALQHPRSDVRFNAAWALGEIGNVSTIPHLVKALQDEDPSVSTRAADALGKIGRSLKGKTVEGKEAKALQLVAEHFREDERTNVIRQAYQAALKGKVTAKNVRLYVKELHAMQGSLK